MQPTLVAQPFHHKGWVYEEKVDGYRMVAHKDDDGITIMSRQGKDHTSRFPDLARALASLPVHSFILDGEVAVYDRAHISRYNQPPPASAGHTHALGTNRSSRHDCRAKGFEK